MKKGSLNACVVGMMLFAVLLSCKSVFAAGNTMDTASSISLDETYSGTNPKDHYDYYRFTLPSSGRITIDAKWIDYSIYDSSGRKICDYDPYWPELTAEEINAGTTVDLRKGTYYFVVYAYRGSGDYSFTLNFTSANESFAEDENINNDTLNSANDLNFNTQYYGQLATLGDWKEEIDYYRITLPSSGRLTVTAQLPEKNKGYGCDLLDSNGDHMPGRFRTTEQTIIKDTYDLAKGTYYYVLEADTYDRSGNYSISVTFSPTPEPVETNTITVPKEPTIKEPAAEIDTITISKKPSIKKLAATKNKITVNWTHFKHTSKKTKKIWKPIKKVQIQCATDKAFSNIVKTVAIGKSKKKATINGLNKNTTYFVRVRYTDNSGYSNWSGVKQIKTKR